MIRVKPETEDVFSEQHFRTLLQVVDRKFAVRRLMDLRSIVKQLRVFGLREAEQRQYVYT